MLNSTKLLTITIIVIAVITIIVIVWTLTPRASGVAYWVTLTIIPVALLGVGFVFDPQPM